MAHKTCVSFGLVNLILQYILWKCLIHILLKNHIKIKKKRDFIDPSNNILVCWATLKKYKLKCKQSGHPKYYPVIMAIWTVINLLVMYLDAVFLVQFDLNRFYNVNTCILHTVNGLGNRHCLWKLFHKGLHTVICYWICQWSTSLNNIV